MEPLILWDSFISFVQRLSSLGGSNLAYTRTTAREELFGTLRLTMSFVYRELGLLLQYCVFLWESDSIFRIVIIINF